MHSPVTGSLFCHVRSHPELDADAEEDDKLELLLDKDELSTELLLEELLSEDTSEADEDELSIELLLEELLSDDVITANEELDDELLLDSSSGTHSDPTL